MRVVALRIFDCEKQNFGYTFDSVTAFFTSFWRSEYHGGVDCAECLKLV